MSFLEYHLLQEARKNPELAPKYAAIVDIKKAVADAELGWGTTHNLFVSFTGLDKLGINPKSKYATPLGVYSYIGDYVANMTSAKSVPFAGRSPFINFFKAKNPGNVLLLNTMKSATFKNLVEKMRKIFIQYYVQELNTDNPYNVSSGESEQDRGERFWKIAIDEFEKIVNDSGQNANVEGLGGRFWYISMRVSEDMAQAKVSKKVGSGKGSNDDKWWKPTKANFGSEDFKIVSEAPLMWNKLFRMIGIDGCIDLGDGIIHGGEPSQAVFFSGDAIEVVDRIKNIDPVNNPMKNEGQIINRIGDHLLSGDGESLGKYLSSVFAKNIESGMVGNMAVAWAIGNNYIMHALKDVFFRRTKKVGWGRIKVDAIEAAMKACEVIMRTNQKVGSSLEHVLDVHIKTELISYAAAGDSEYVWPILIYLIKMFHTKEASYLLKYILRDNDTLSHYQEIMKVCQKYDCEWWNDPDYAEVTEQFDKVFNVDNDPEFYPDWWKVRGGFKKGNV